MNDHSRDELNELFTNNFYEAEPDLRGRIVCKGWGYLRYINNSSGISGSSILRLHYTVNNINFILCFIIPICCYVSRHPVGSKKQATLPVFLAKTLTSFDIEICRMSEITLAIAFLSAGIALSMGMVSLFIGLHRNGQRVDLVFGALCILMFLFFVVPPVGFVLDDQAPYPARLLIKRIFNFSFYGLIPWFVYYYTGYRKKLLPIFISIADVLTYVWMATTKINREVPLWIYPVIFLIGLILVYSFRAVRYMYSVQQDYKAKWFRFALILFAAFFIVFTIYQIGNSYFIRIFHVKVFFPVNIFPLVFIMIMGVRMRMNAIEKFQLEKSLGLKERQWKSLLDNIQLVIVRLDREGNIQYINPFGVRILKYERAGEIIGKNWFDHFITGSSMDSEKIFLNDHPEPPETFYKNSVIAKDGVEKIMNWKNEIILNEDGSLEGIMSIGLDVTEMEQAYEKIQELRMQLEKENLILKGEPLPDWMQQEIIGNSAVLTYALQKAKKVAASQASVLLEGETGVGKELFADLIHRNSMRKDQPLIKVNCAALPAELIEDELFGHEKGAFTGAANTRKGRFELADGGTIFLDEIGELPLSLQPKLLRVLQNGEFQRIGGQQTIKVDVRVIAATNRNLKSETEQGRFRDDLYYRLNVYPIVIPPLRERKEDIPMLIHYFIDRESKKHGKSFNNISKADINRLCEYDWKGNIRELRNVIERSVISSENNQSLRLDWFHPEAKDPKGLSGPASLEQIERAYILKVLEECHWRISGERGAAEKLVMNPNTLRSKMKKLNITRQGNN